MHLLQLPKVRPGDPVQTPPFDGKDPADVLDSDHDHVSLAHTSAAERKGVLSGSGRDSSASVSVLVSVTGSSEGFEGEDCSMVFSTDLSFTAASPAQSELEAEV